MAHSIVIAPAAKRQLANLPEGIRSKASVIIDGLAVNPRPSGVKKLKGMDAWRIRVGDYRIIYEINDGIACVLVNHGCP